jgi:hypothetical protein
MSYEELYTWVCSLSADDKSLLLHYLCGYFDDNDEFVNQIGKWAGRNGVEFL